MPVGQARIAAATLGPAAADTAMMRAVYPMPVPSRCFGKMKRTSAMFTLMMPAAPSPCRKRAARKIQKFPQWRRSVMTR